MRTKVIDALIEKYSKAENLPTDPEQLYALKDLLTLHLQRCREERDALKWLVSVAMPSADKMQEKIDHIANDA